jgi:hypothetical protein
MHVVMRGTLAAVLRSAVGMNPLPRSLIQLSRSLDEFVRESVSMIFNGSENAEIALLLRSLDFRSARV